MTATADGTSTARPSAAASRGAAHGVARDLARAGAAPLICSLVLVVGLAVWVIIGGGGSLTRIRISVTQAAVPMLSFTDHATAGRTAPVYLTLRNLSGNGDVLVSASSPDAARVELTSGRGGVSGRSVAGLPIPAGATVSLSPFGPDLVLVGPGPLVAGQQVQLVLRFRHAGVVTVEATVTPPGTP